MRQKVVLDTSALIIHGRGRQDVFDLVDKFIGYPEVIVPSFIKQELETIAERSSGSRKVAAGIALQMFDRLQVVVGPSPTARYQCSHQY